MSREPKSRFRSAALKKIEKEVRNHARLRGHGVASRANHRGKPVMGNNIGHKRNIVSNEKFASLTMNGSKSNKRGNVANDANRRDNSLLDGETPIKDSNTRHKNSTMNGSPDPLLRDGRKNIKHDNTSAMHASSATLSRTDNKMSVVVEANRQVSHASRPIKQDPLRKNTNSKRDIMPNGNVTRRDVPIVPLRNSHDPLKAKTTMNRLKHINNSQLPQFKAMEGLVPRTKNFGGLDGYSDASPSRLNREVSLNNGGGFIVDNHSDRKSTIKATEEASPKRTKKQRNKEAEGDDTSDSDRNPMDESNGDASPFGDYYVEGNVTYGPMKRQQGNMKRNEDGALDNSHMKLMEVEDGGTQSETHNCRLTNKEKRRIESNEVCDGKADDSFAKKNLESLPKGHVLLDCSNEAIGVELLTQRKLKKRKRDIMRNEDEYLHVDGGDNIPLDADGDSLRLNSQAPTSIDYLAKVPAPFVSEHFERQCNYCSKPIDKPILSGILKIDGEEYISLAGHLSTKSCDKVWELSRSLGPVIEVTKLSSSKFKIWETSKPSCDNIGLYFFSNKTRHDEDLDKVVKEVIEGDLVLQTVIGEAEMLIFPSTLLPERYKTFQRKHYLWGVFRPRQDQCATVTEPVHDTVCCATENEEEQHASNQQDEVQGVHWKSPDKSMQQAAASRGVPWSPNIDFQPEAPEERRLGDALCHNLHSAEAIAVATVTTEAAAVATNLAAVTTEGAALANNPAANPAAVTTEGAALATNPAAITTEGAAIATNPAAVTTEAVATNPAAVTTEAAALATNAATIPTEADENDTNAPTIPANHGQSDSTVGVPPGSILCFVAGQNPKVEQLIQEMQREGMLVLAIRGEPIGGGLWPGNIASTNISRA